MLGLLSAQVTVLALGDPFPDVDGTTEHAAAIDFLQTKGIISGYPDGTFKPGNTNNRAEALKLVLLGRKSLALADITITQKPAFPDVTKSDWFYSYVEQAFNLKIVQGYSDGNFKPANEITAAESLKIIYSGLVPGFQLPQLTAAPFTDVPADQWFAPYLEYGRNRQLIEALGDGSYHPGRKMTRAEFAEAIYRTLYSESNKLEKFPLSQNWRYCNNYELGYKAKRPYSWLTLSAGNQQIFWKQDIENGQISFARVFPNSAVAIVAVDDNKSGLSLETYLNQIEYGTGASKQMLTLNGMSYGSILIEQNGLQDSYFQLPSGKILIVYAQFGNGPLVKQLKEELRYIIGSVRESNSADSSDDNCLSPSVITSSGSGSTGGGTGSAVSASDQLKTEILKLVLVDAKASEALQKLTDETLFETDSIGIGTGPVDYYYSQTLNLTLKIDRNSDTILATQPEKNSSF
jgi:hypothetical protein